MAYTTEPITLGGGSTELRKVEVDRRWWLMNTLQAGDSCWSTFKIIEGEDAGRIRDYQEFYRLYTNQDLLMRSPSARGRSRITLNVIKAVIDTAASRIARQNPRSKFATFGGNRSMIKRAQLLERWVDGTKYASNADKECVLAFKDACIFGTGILHVGYRGKEIYVERVYPGEVFVDPGESMDGCPRTFFRQKFIDKEYLKELFPGKREAIDGLGKDRRNNVDFINYATQGAHRTDQIEVIEAWHLGEESKHIITAQGVTLAFETFKMHCLPLAFMVWDHDPRGFWGLGLCHELLGIQVELNRVLAKLQKIISLVAPQLWLDLQSMVKGQRVTNEVGAMYHYRNNPPFYSEGSKVPDSILVYIQQLWDRAFSQTGINQMLAGDRPPPDVTAAVAIQEVADQGSMRFSLVVREWEWFHRELTEILVETGRELARKYPSYTVVAAKDKYTIEQVKWSDVDLEKDSYTLRVFPASALPQSPSGRLQRVMDLYDRQIIGGLEAKELLDWPDFERQQSLDKASADNIDRIIEQMLDDGVYEAPEPFQDQQLALKMVQTSYNRALGMDVPEDRLELLRRYMSATQKMIEKATMAQMAPTPMGPGMGAPLPPGPSGQAPQAITPMDANPQGNVI